jgi:hypothetical protein
MNGSTAENPLGLGLVVIGALAMAIAAFLPLDEPTGAFSTVRDNTLVQHGGWALIGLAVGVVGSGYRASQGTSKGKWWLPLVLCIIAALVILGIANDKGLRTLYPIGPGGTPDTSQPGTVASLGVAIYVAGAGVAAAFIGSLILRQSSQQRLEDADVADSASLVGAVAGPETKRCPDCAETVLADARVCKHCSYRFAPLADG